MQLPIAPQDRFSKRKAPRQRRSSSTVDSIKQATHELIQKEGFTDLGTGRIAERAGVSIGSLYQYFPNYEAILLSLYEDVSSQSARTMRLLTAELSDAYIDQEVPIIIKRLLALHRKHRLILVDLVTAMPQLRLTAHPLSYQNLIRNTIKADLERRSPYLTPCFVQRKAFFVEQIVLGCIRRFVADPPPHLTAKDFLSDLSSITLSYIKGSLTDC
jgi:AcrR family transcriptional regulator